MTTVLHIAKVSHIAGAERHLLILLPGLRAEGLDVRMLVLENPDKPASEFTETLEQAGVPVQRLAFPLRKSLIGRRSPAALRAVCTAIRQHQPTVVHTHLIHADLYGIPAARLNGVRRVVCSRHNLDPFRQWWQWKLLLTLLWSMAARGIAVSDAVRQFVITHEHAAANKIRTIYYGISEYTRPLPTRDAIRAQWGIPADAPVVGSVSRLVTQKGLQYGLEAFAAVHQQLPQAHYIIAGDGELRPALEAQAAALGLGEAVHFLGWCSDTHTVFHALDVLLAPSLWEGLPIAFLEAMSHALPIISTRVGPMPEAVQEGETGFLAEPTQAAALVEPLTRLLTDPDLRARMGAAGQQHQAQIFSAARMVRETLDVYQELLR